MVPIFEVHMCLRCIVYSNFANSGKTRSFDVLKEVQSSRMIWSSTKKRQHLYSEVFKWFSVKGARRKVFHEVWRVVIGRLSVLEDNQHLGWCRAAYIAIILYPRRFCCDFYAHNSFFHLLKCLNNREAGGTPRMSGFVSYAVAWIRRENKGPVLGLRSHGHVTDS